jgi:hypothetical protein
MGALLAFLLTFSFGFGASVPVKHSGGLSTAGQTGYEGQPGNQSNGGKGSNGTSEGLKGYEGQPGNQGGNP